MSNQQPEVQTLVDLPEGAIPLGAVEVVSYLDADGTSSYAFRWPGSMTYTQVLGLLELVKAQVIRRHFDGR